MIEKNEPPRVREENHAKRVAAMQASLTGLSVAMNAGPENVSGPSKGIMPTARRASSSDLSKTSSHYAEKLPTYKEALAAANRAANQPSTGKDLSNAFTFLVKDPGFETPTILDLSPRQSTGAGPSGEYLLGRDGRVWHHILAEASPSQISSSRRSLSPRFVA